MDMRSGPKLAMQPARCSPSGYFDARSESGLMTGGARTRAKNGRHVASKRRRAMSGNWEAKMFTPRRLPEAVLKIYTFRPVPVGAIWLSRTTTGFLFCRSMRLGPLEPSSPLFLSPLAGYTNLPMRQTLRELGGLGWATTDLVNARS